MLSLPSIPQIHLARVRALFTKLTLLFPPVHVTDQVRFLRISYLLCFGIFSFCYGLSIFETDANDFDNYAMALTAFEDTYLTMLDCDGPEATDKLRRRMYSPDADTAPELAWLRE